MSIEIPVKAQLNQQDLNAQIQQLEAALNDLGRVAQATGKVKFQPISNTTLDEAKRIRAEFEAIQRMAPGLKKALETGGQKGKGLEAIDWGQVWTNPNQRGGHAWSLLNRLKPGSLQTVKPAEPAPNTAPAPGGGNGAGADNGGSGSGGGSGKSPRPGRKNPRHTDGEGPNSDGEDDDDGSTPGTRGRKLWRRVGSSALAGVAGGAASQIGGMPGAIAGGALSGGMMGGPLGALIGGLSGALTGVLGAMSSARDVAVALDILKRSLGDTGVSFGELQLSTRSLSDEFGLTDAESTKLTTDYARTAGSGKDAAGLRDEVGVGVGFSRAFGLDPSAGVGFFGQMRGLGITQGADDSKRLALLIGEAVAKAGDLPRMADVLANLNTYMANTAERSLSAPNSSEWLSKFAGLERTGFAGITPGTTSNMIAKADAAVAQGGLNEAGRNFMLGVLQKHGLNPIQAQAQLEGGLFATGRSTFGDGSALGSYYQKNGIAAPALAGSNETNLSLLTKSLQSDYQGRPELMLDAMKGLFGLNYAQSAAWQVAGSQKVGGLVSRMGRLGISPSGVNATGIAKLSQIEADGSLSDTQKDEMIREAASKNQEDTLGSEARANSAKMANGVERLATEGLPMLNAIQAGIMKMAGVDTPGQLIKQMDHAKRVDAINSDLGAKKDAAKAERDGKISFLHRGVPALQTPEEAAIDKRYWDAKGAHDQALSEEDARYSGDLKTPDPIGSTGTPGTSSGSTQQSGPSASSGGAIGGGASGVTPEILRRAAQSDALHNFPAGTTAALIMQESHYNTGATSSKGARGPFQLMPDNIAALSKQTGRKLDPTNWDDSFLMYDKLMGERDRKYGDNTEKKLRSYHGGYDETAWGPVNADYIPAIERQRRRMEAEQREASKFQVNVHQIGEFTLRDTNGQQLAVAEVQTAVGIPTPQGSLR